jgi:hypothetical protein
VTLSFSPLSLSEVHRRRAARVERRVERIGPMPELDRLEVELDEPEVVR